MWGRWKKELRAKPTALPKKILNGEKRFQSLNFCILTIDYIISVETQFLSLEWQMGLMYGCLVEDVATGLAIQCRGWRSMYHNPRRKGFMGVAPITLLSALAQIKRWGEGHLDIIFSRNSPLIQGFGKIGLAQQLSYCHYNFWALNSIPHLYYVVVPSLCLLNGLSLYPKVTN